MTLFTKTETFSNVFTIALSKGRSPSLPYFSSSWIVSTIGSAYIFFSVSQKLAHHYYFTLPLVFWILLWWKMTFFYLIMQFHLFTDLWWMFNMIECFIVYCTHTQKESNKCLHWLLKFHRTSVEFDRREINLSMGSPLPLVHLFVLFPQLAETQKRFYIRIIAPLKTIKFVHHKYQSI